MLIRVLGAHNLESHEARHTCFLIDGVLGVDAGSLSSALTPAEQGQVQAVLLTHHHFDHIRDIPTLGLAALDNERFIELYGLSETLESLRAHLMDGQIYPDFSRELNDLPPRYFFRPVKPWVPFPALRYQVKPIPMPHTVQSLGYIIRSEAGSCVAYTGDTGGDLMAYFQGDAPPSVLFVDVTFPDRLEARAKLTGHLTPALLGCQLRAALDLKVRLPRIIPVHLAPRHQKEIEEDLKIASEELQVDLTPAREDMVLH